MLSGVHEQREDRKKIVKKYVIDKLKILKKIYKKNVLLEKINNAVLEIRCHIYPVLVMCSFNNVARLLTLQVRTSAIYKLY